MHCAGCQRPMGGLSRGWRVVSVFVPSGSRDVSGALLGDATTLVVCPSCRSSGDPAVARALLAAFSATERPDDVS